MTENHFEGRLPKRLVRQSKSLLRSYGIRIGNAWNKHLPNAKGAETIGRDAPLLAMQEC